MTKKMYMCPHCNVQVRYLKRHIERMHPEQATPKRSHHKKPGEAFPSPTKTKGKKLELKTQPVKSLEPVERGYHCVDCGGPLAKGQSPCPGCGTSLDWRGL